ncbi:hypothetical protein CC78DRAFT_608927 [Lojkania enalia]|uniref:Uncharacterized protein n=1 Tax=Lojkania enalia TaxID=147567 RepID=A0A9P4N6H2_9PLEO|nr:hypothetical protein CC78DRAFT_608927 [Didymosphaeria enalia]
MAVKLTAPSSSSKIPTLPNPTLQTGSLRNDMDSLPDTELTVVSHTLEPIAEDASETGYPHVLVNTPEGLISPAQSACNGRACSMSTIGDQLAKLKSSNRCQYYVNEDADSSVRSTTHHPIDENEIEDSKAGSIRLSPISLGFGDIPIALGSPVANPRIDEYLAYQSTSLLSPGLPDDIKDAEELAKVNKKRSVGVTESSNWAEDIEQDFVHLLKRLENLARDEFENGQDMSIDDYYIRRLNKYLSAEGRMKPVMVTVKGVEYEKRVDEE